MQKKAMVVLSNAENQGKTETLREFARLLVAEMGEKVVIFPVGGVVPDEGDFVMVVRVGEGRVGIVTAGDYGGYVDGALSEMVTNFAPRMIFCASRTKGWTVDAVNEVAGREGYEVIWSSTYLRIGGAGKVGEELAARRGELNRLMARHLRDMMGATLG